MDRRRVGAVFVKDLRIGPRSPILLWAIVIPVLLTVLVQGVFGDLFAPTPRLGIVDLGRSELTASAEALEGIEVERVEDRAELVARVEDGTYDAGLVLQPGFDEAVRSGQQPLLDLMVGGESFASDRILLAVTTMDLVRGVSGQTPPIDVEVVTLGDPGVPFDLRMLPMIVVLAVAIAGAMIPAASLVEEKEKRTLHALLVSPMTMREVLAAKGALGVLLAVLTGTVTLAVNQVLATAPVVSLLAIALGAIMMAEVGLILGAWAPDTNTLFAAWKGGSVVLIFPVVTFLWPDLPGWIGRLGPTYYFLHPVYAANVEGAGLRDVAAELAVAAAVCVALLPAVVWAGGWLEGRLAGVSGTTTSTRDRTPVDA